MGQYFGFSGNNFFFFNTVDDMPTSEFGTPLSAGKRLPFVNRCKDAMYIRQ